MKFVRVHKDIKVRVPFTAPINTGEGLTEEETYFEESETD